MWLFIWKHLANKSLSDGVKYKLMCVVTCTVMCNYCIMSHLSFYFNSNFANGLVFHICSPVCTAYSPTIYINSDNKKRYCNWFSKQFTAPSLQADIKSCCYCWTSFLDAVSESVWPAWLPPVCCLCPWPVSTQLCFKEANTARTPKQILRLFSNT